jgi:hypothetical protein
MSDDPGMFRDGDGRKCRTVIQRLKYTEEDFRGERFKDHSHDQKGNNDLLSVQLVDDRFHAVIGLGDRGAGKRVRLADVGAGEEVVEAPRPRGRQTRGRTGRPPPLRCRRHRPDQPHAVDLAGREHVFVSQTSAPARK